MARPIVHHRSPEFEAVFARVREGLAWLYQTKQDVLVFAASGTGAMEASFVNFLRKGDTAVVVDGGKFGERWGKLAQVTARTGAILVVDAISSLGAMPLPMDEWGIDVMVSAGHKALGLPPGIAFL